MVRGWVGACVRVADASWVAETHVRGSNCDPTLFEVVQMLMLSTAMPSWSSTAVFTAFTVAFSGTRTSMKRPPCALKRTLK